MNAPWRIDSRRVATRRRTTAWIGLWTSGGITVARGPFTIVDWPTTGFVVETWTAG